MVNVLGPDVHVKNIGKIHFVQFAPDGVFGWILKDILLIDSLLTGTEVVFFNLVNCDCVSGVDKLYYFA